MGNKFCSALFVDFDNIYSRLKDISGLAANNFATQPYRWLEWLEKAMPVTHMDEGATSRRILIRKCYLNPKCYGDFRPHFSRAAFEVTDCPELTKGGKTSTDIHMVMDIMDALRHPSRFDEFILLSADADFSPVLIRVRQHNRRSVVFSVGYSSPAYRSAADYLPPENVFLSQALGIYLKEDEDEKPRILQPVSKPGLKTILDKLAKQVLLTLENKPIAYADELVGIYRRVDEFRTSTTWLDHGSLRVLSEAMIKLHPELEVVEEKDDVTWGLQKKEGTGLVELSSVGKLPAPTTPTTEQPLKNGELRKAIGAWVVNMVKSSAKPVALARLADGINEQFGAQINGSVWLGAGTFKALLEQLDLKGLKHLTTGPGYLYDLSRHDITSYKEQPVSDDRRAMIEEEFKSLHPQIEPLARKIHDLTDMPYLLPKHYGMILNQVARAVNEEGYQLNKITRLVRDRCVERGAPVARGHANFVVIGISYAGYKLGENKPENPEALAEALYQNTLNLCQSAQLSLSESECALVKEWITSCLDQPS